MSGIEYKEGLVSFCCLGYKHSKFIEENIEAIWNQDYKSIEIIALDDGSNDGSAQLLEELQAKSPVPMRLILQENSGNVAKNFNTLTEEAKGEYIYYTSMDDFPTKDTISSKLPYFEKDENLVFVANKSCNIVNNDSKVLKKQSYDINWQKWPHQTAKDMIDIEFNNLHSVYIQGTLYKKKYIDIVGGFDNDLLGDDIIIRTKIYQHMEKNPQLKFKLLEKAGVYYRFHDSNIHKNSTRTIKLTIQWKNRYFKDRRYPQKFYSWLYQGIATSLSLADFDTYMELMETLKTILENEDKAYQKEKINSLQETLAIKEKSYLIPFIFEVKYTKNNNNRKTAVKLFGLNIFEHINCKRNKKKTEVKLLSITIYKK